MQAVNENDVVRPNLHRGLIVVALAGLEIVERNEHLLSGDQAHQVFIDQFQVEGLRGLEIVVAKLVLGMELQRFLRSGSIQSRLA